MATEQQVYPGNYLTKDDCNGDLTLCIERLKFDEVKTPDGKASRERLCYFKDSEKPLILNKTNWRRVAAMYGKNDDNWAGHWVTLFNDKTIVFAGEVTGGIRVRPHKPAPEVASAEAVVASADTEGGIPI